MKKLICLCLVVLMLLSVVACGRKDKPIIPNDNPSETQPNENKTEQDSQKPNDNSSETQPGENKPEQESQKEIEESDVVETEYLLFEELFSEVTDLVRAEYIGDEKVDGASFDYRKFKLVENVVGLGLPEEFRVQYQPRSYSVGGHSYSTKDHPYQVGQEYYLLLTRYRSVYDSEDVLSYLEMIMLPATEEGMLDMAHCTLYGTGLTNHVKNAELSEAIEKGELLSVMKQYVEANPRVHGGGFVDSDSLAEILAGADCVFRIVLKGETLPAYDRTTYLCEVKDVLLGTWSEKYANVIMPHADGVEIGSEWIVAVKKMGSDYFSFVGRNSYYPVSMENEIVNAIKTLE